MTHEIQQESAITGVEMPIFDSTKHSNITKKAVTLGLVAAVAPTAVACETGNNTNPTEANQTPIVEETNNPSFGTPLPTEGPVDFTPAPSDPLETGEPNTGNVSPEPTLSPEPIVELPTAMEAAKQILNQAKSEIDETSLGSIEKKINKLWDEYGEVLNTVVLDGEKLSRKGMLDYIDLMKKGMSKNIPIKQIIEERAGFSAGLSALELGTYNKVEDPEIKKMLLDSADDNFDYAMTSISSKSSDIKSIKKYFTRDLPYLLDYYLNS